MNSRTDTDGTSHKNGLLHKLVGATLLLSLLALGTGFSGALDGLIHRWNTQDEYSHGYLIVVVSLYLLWQKRFDIRELQFQPSWAGAASVAGFAVIALIGELAALYILIHYAFVGILLGLALALMGWQGLRVVLVPVLLLLFAIPLPYFIDTILSGELQLLSSGIGVSVIRFFDIPVYLEGNIIDLGVHKLQVVEACSGLRYLYPLMSFGFICAYIWRAPFWKKSVLFLSTIPITILMNSFRIGVTGVITDTIGIAAAEGFMHDFEGWFIFMACVLVLFIEMWILARIGNGYPRGWDMFDLGGTPPSETSSTQSLHTLPGPFVFSTSVIILVALSGLAVSERPDNIPKRAPLSGFPMNLDEWRGQHDNLTGKLLDNLKLTDYLLVDYARPDGGIVNFYVAYYENQRKGASPHSPRACIPGGGWRITSLSREKLSLDGGASTALNFNRVIIKRGDTSQLVYYWFQQRGRLMANEYLVKWYLLVDALFRNRTDGALVRLTTPIAPGLQSTAAADQRLSEFARSVVTRLNEYIPE